MKKLMAVLMVVAIVITCTACGGLDINKIKGDWTVSTINGTSLADYAASLGVDASAAAVNMTINEDGTLVSKNSTGEQTFKYEKKADGIEVKDDTGAVAMSMKYDDSAKTLTYSVTDGTNTITMVLVQGTTDLTAAAPVEDASTAEVTPDAATAEVATADASTAEVVADAATAEVATVDAVG